ncbi:WG repeat-containing protein [bacterium]|nr:WG repeat-containing protein [bacterium]
MKRVTLLLLMLLTLQSSAFASSTVFSENEKFGLKNDSGEVVTKAKYKKLVRLGEKAWIMQDGNRFGILSDNGKILEEAKYSQAERVLGKFVKLKKGEKYGIFDEMGFEILPVEYSSIDLLYGGLFVTCKNFKYGISDFNGQMVVDNIFDDIYVKDFNKLILVYEGQIYQVERKDHEVFDPIAIHGGMEYMVSKVETNPLAATGYYGVTVADYILKIVSSISPAYEKTIDELMYSQGADTVNVLMKFSWLPKFPFIYARKYYNTYIDPTNGPLSSVKSNLKSK